MNYSLTLLDLAQTISFPRIYRRKLQLCMIPLNLKYICLCPVVSTESRKRLLSFCGIGQRRKKTLHIEYWLCAPFMLGISHVLTDLKRVMWVMKVTIQRPCSLGTPQGNAPSYLGFCFEKPQW